MTTIIDDSTQYVPVGPGTATRWPTDEEFRTAWQIQKGQDAAVPALGIAAVHWEQVAEDAAEWASQTLQAGTESWPTE